MPQVTIRPKGQVTIPAEVLQQWRTQHSVNIHDNVEVTLSNGVLMFTPTKRPAAKRDIMSFAGIAKGLWGDTPAQTETSLREIRDTWVR